MLKIVLSSVFKSELKKIRAPKDVAGIQEIILCLQSGAKLGSFYRPHTLKGSYKGYEECHIKPDLLMIYRRTDEALYLYRIGSHAELFK